MSDAGAAPQPALGPIRCVTFTAADLGAVEHCYTHYLGYRVVARDPLPAALATAWEAPAMAGRDTLTLAPAAAEDFFFRAVAADVAPDYVPFGSFGWNAAEIMVQHVDTLADQLAGSPFRIIGEPQDLSFSEDIRAMQVLGPGGELLYLTEFKRPVPGLDVPAARCSVDRTFIVILGGPAMAAMQDFYARRFAIPGAPTVPSRVKGLSAAFGLSPEHRHPIAALPLAGQCLIEVDEMPAAATRRAARAGELPPGIAVVSFGCTRLPGPVLSVAGPPYAAGQAGLVRGAAGELLELLPEPA